MDSRLTKIEPCKHRGEVIATFTSNCCGYRGTKVEMYRCALYRVCTYRPYKGGQPEKVCLRCSEAEPIGISAT